MTLVAAKDLAATLGVNEDTVYRWAARREIPFLRLPSGTIRFPLEEIVETLRVNPEEAA